MTLTESQRKRIADMWRNYTGQYGRMTKHYIEFTEKIFTELAPAVFEEGQQAGLEEAAKLIEHFPDGYGTGQAARIRALKDSK